MNEDGRINGCLWCFSETAEQCVCVNSLFLTCCPSLRDCSTKGRRKISSTEWKQQLGYRNHKRWKPCVCILCVLMHILSFNFESTSLMIKDAFLFGAQGTVPEVLQSGFVSPTCPPRDLTKTKQIGPISYKPHPPLPPLLSASFSSCSSDLAFPPFPFFPNFAPFLPPPYPLLPSSPLPQWLTPILSQFSLNASSSQFVRAVQALTLRLNRLPPS